MSAKQNGFWYKIVTFVSSIPIPKASMGRHTYGIRRFCTLWFWRSMNFANSTVSQKQSNAERLMRCIIYSSHCLRMFYTFVGRESRLYTYTGVGLSALLVSTYRAMRRPIDRGTSDRMALRFFLCINCNNNLLKFRKWKFTSVI